MAVSDPIRPGIPSRRSHAILRRAADRIWAGGTFLFAAVIVLLILWIGVRLYLDCGPTREKFGWGMLTNPTWDVPHEVYGAATFIFGTLVSAFLALLIAVPIGIGAALFLTEVAPKWLAGPISFVVELLAAVPSIVYGLWGFTVMCPFLQQHVSPWLNNKLGANPLFGGTPVLTNVLAAGLILAIMVMPFITAISREVIRTVPGTVRDAALGLGSTRWETIKNVVLPSAKTGISGACILGLGRAIGETMAVVMVIGNTPQIKASLLGPAYTMSGKLANEFNEASTDKLQLSALLEIALILFVLTFLVNAAARVLIMATQAEVRGTSSGSGWFGALRKVAVKAPELAGRFVFRGLALGLIGLQVFCDVREYGAAAFGRGFELLVILGTLLALAPRVVHLKGQALRHVVDRLMRGLFSACGLIGCGALGAVLYFVAMRGLPGLTPQLFTNLPTPTGIPGGGLRSAILGTVELVAIASAIGIPVGLLAGVFVSEFARGRFGSAVRFAADVLNGIPTVVIGLFAYAAFVLPFGHFSAWAGGLALAVIMIPTVARTTEDMLRLVPDSYREAALGLGASKAQSIRTVILPAAKAGIVTGIVLGIARIAGETAPLLFTAFGSDSADLRPSQPVSSLTMKIYQYAISPYDDWVSQAWAGALVLLCFVCALSLVARFLVSRSSRMGRAA